MEIDVTELDSTKPWLFQIALDCGITATTVGLVLDHPEVKARYRESRYTDEEYRQMLDMWFILGRLRQFAFDEGLTADEAKIAFEAGISACIVLDLFDLREKLKPKEKASP